ncbi:UbiH/UbiF/VisC/COQ6 family ubiquinone biosynthesis hydroxylase, partial [Candidatus Albibeggiatoa sp. nov. NOAA]|uniref:UbiH/UbiF/VisC/COQ6 family ubiquinone biosynthesis hydroxylase n=1 Tax=Candidatus Albibeggiatoa sp. nov. NOAA TaxID=3162724 RepID=UPI0032FE332A|nr:UbiH/UbiF/VisC/COQ6 family ubiquinone biosynthesis hydroxylase [Thiotrichaceae bacterium]
GNTLAAILLQQNFNVGIVEASLEKPWDTDQADLRTFALTRASEQVFRHTQTWDAMQATRISPYEHMHVWDATGSGEIHFDCADIHEPALGYIVEQSVIQKALTQRLNDFDNLTMYRPLKVENFELAGSTMQVHLDNGETVSTRLLVGAEGAHSYIRYLSGIPYDMHDYGQQAIVANIKTELPHQLTAWQRFLPTGPLAFLPLQDKHWCSIVWSVDSPHALRLMDLEQNEFHTELEAAFEHKLGTILDSSQRVAFPLQSRVVRQYVQPRLALIGDAAHTVHPLAGQGVNLGLLDAATLGEVLINAKHEDFGQKMVLRRYERWRKGHNAMMAGAMYGFKHLFGHSAQPVKWLRNMGLNLTNSSSMVKKVIMRQAMALEGDLPQLIRY